MKQYQIVAVMSDGKEGIFEFENDPEGFDDKLAAKTAAAQLIACDDERGIVRVKVIDVKFPVEIDGQKVPKVIYTASRS